MRVLAHELPRQIHNLRQRRALQRHHLAPLPHLRAALRVRGHADRAVLREIHAVPVGAPVDDVLEPEAVAEDGVPVAEAGSMEGENGGEVFGVGVLLDGGLDGSAEARLCVWGADGEAELAPFGVCNLD